MNLPEDFTFSQSSLQDYVDCPRRFYLKHIQRQKWPAPEVDDMLAFERRMEQGERFHHLVQQHLVGIPEDLLLKRLEDADVRRWFETYLQTGLQDLPQERRPEKTLTVALGAFALLAKFDLLAIESGKRAVIVDWKTGQHVPRAETLAQRLQTIVYRYVLAKGGAVWNGNQPITPEQIEMVYWYAEQDGAERRFGYDAAQFAADETYLLGLVQEIQTREEFQLTADEKRCRFCVYRSLCERGREAGSLAEWESGYEADDSSDFDLDLDQIAEIEY